MAGGLRIALPTSPHNPSVLASGPDYVWIFCAPAWQASRFEVWLAKVAGKICRRLLAGNAPNLALDEGAVVFRVSLSSIPLVPLP